MIPLHDNIRSATFPFMTLFLIGLNFYVFFQEFAQGQALLTGFGLIPAVFLKNLLHHPLTGAAYLPLISNLFLHGGWMHIIGNMWYLWIFGDNVEDRLGHLRYLLFYLACGIAANISQVIVDPASTVPTIGASGAISGILGAYFISFPRASIATLIPLFILFPVVHIPAIIFLGFWFFLQLENGTAAFALSGTNIAWWAHIGGFVIGMFLLHIFLPRRRRI